MGLPSHPQGLVGGLVDICSLLSRWEMLYEHYYNTLTKICFSSLPLSVIRFSDQIILCITLPFSFSNTEQATPGGTYAPLKTFFSANDHQIN